MQVRIKNVTLVGGHLRHTVEMCGRETVHPPPDVRDSYQWSELQNQVTFLTSQR